MGQGAQFTVVNGTPYAFKRVEQDAYQMNNWSFPDQVGAFSSQNVYVEWNQSIFHTTGDDQGNVVYQIDTGTPGDNLTFKLHAVVVNGNFHIYAFNNFNSQTQPANTSVDLGWIHDGTMSYGVTGDKNSQFISTGFNASAWMKNNLGLIGSRTLSDICIPGSHDSGMSTLGSATAFSYACNTQTQTHNIGTQLNLGIRYFDIRPVIGGGQYYTGHYSKVINTTWQGARGQSISDIIANINDFTANNNELVVLNLSHAYDTDAGNSNYPAFTAAQWNGLLNQLKQLNHLYVAEQGATPDFTQMRLDSLIKDSSRVLVILEEPANGTELGNCFFPYTSFNAFNSYAGSNNFSAMAADQIGKMRAQKAGGAYFLLSWTLTQSDTQAATCFLDPTGQTSGILDLANQANQNLFASLAPAVTKTVFPNILYIDNVADSNAALMSMYVNTLVPPAEKVNIQSAADKNIYLRMDGQNVNAPVASGGGTVNCQFNAGPWERFNIIPQADGSHAIGSIQYPGVFLRMDGQAMVVNCQYTVGPWEKFQLVTQPNGGVAIASCQWPGVYLSMNPEGMNAPAGPGGGYVTAKRGLDSSTTFNLAPIANG